MDRRHFVAAWEMGGIKYPRLVPGTYISYVQASTATPKLTSVLAGSMDAIHPKPHTYRCTKR